jgi:uncharacterized repeat protein (TIGR03803 family)
MKNPQKIPEEASYGVIFRINTDGADYTNLYSFSYFGNCGGCLDEGKSPYGSLVLNGARLYGMTYGGGTSNSGTVFNINTNGAGFANLHSFGVGSDGAYPYGSIAFGSSNLFGMTYQGGAFFNSGILFKLGTDGSSYTNLHGFAAGSNDGASPMGSLVLSGAKLYGMTRGGGSSYSDGMVFQISSDGSGYTNLHIFYGGSFDGARPNDSLILSGTTLYGMTTGGGASGVGTVFSLALPQPPRLTAIRSAANIILMWPTNAAGFTLQFTTNLLSQAVWNTNVPSPIVVNGRNAVTNPISGTLGFFRLSQ